MTASLVASGEAQVNAATASALLCFVEALEAWSAAERAAWEVGRGGPRQAGVTDMEIDGSDEEVA